jgi:hypothetical protein
MKKNSLPVVTPLFFIFYAQHDTLIPQRKSSLYGYQKLQIP